MLAVAPKASNIVEMQERAAVIGEVREEPARMAVVHIQFGGTRMIDMLVGNPLSKICSKALMSRREEDSQGDRSSDAAQSIWENHCDP